MFDINWLIITNNIRDLYNNVIITRFTNSAVNFPIEYNIVALSLLQLQYFVRIRKQGNANFTTSQSLKTSRFIRG